MDITPKVNLLKSLRGERINYPLLIGEGIDNALDAGATSVAISVNENEIAFSDNGVGITQDRIESLFSLGDHGPMSTTQLGRFGIGIKHQAVNAGNIFRVASTSHDGKVRVEVDWRDVLKTGRWEIADPRWRPIVVGTETGTTITIADLRRPPNTPLEKIRQEVAMQFRPAIADGKRISINGVEIELLPDPEVTDAVERQFSLSGGKTAKLHAGVLVHPSKLNRVHIAYKHRVIMPGSTLGCGEYGGLNKMFARLQLSGPWHLAKFKDDLTDESERDELEEVVNEALRPILERCSSESMTIRIAQLTKAVNELVPTELQPARPHHRSASNKAKDKTAGAKSGGGSVEPDKSDIGGPARAKRQPHDQLVISFDGDADSDGIGSMKGGGKIKHVSLSAAHPYIAELMTLRDERLVARTILVVAMAIFEHHRTRQEDLLDPFGKRIANMLAINEATAEALRR